MKATYKEFGKYLRAIANLYAQYGEKELKHNDEFIVLYDELCKLHPDYDHGAQRIEELKEVFLTHCEIYGAGWNDPKPESEYKQGLDDLFYLVVNDSIPFSKRKKSIDDFIDKYKDKKESIIQELKSRIQKSVIWKGKLNVNLILNDLKTYY